MILYGPAGRGKTNLAEWLLRQPEILRRYTHIIHLAAGAALRPEGWAALLEKEISFADATAPEVDLLIYADDLHTAQQLQALRDLLPSKAVILASTRYTEVLTASVPPACIEVLPFSIAETETMLNRYRLHHKVSAADVWQATQGNAYATHIALSLLPNHEWQNLLAALAVPPALEAERSSHEANLWRWLLQARETLEPSLRAAFDKFGALPPLAGFDVDALASLWQMSVARARLWAEQIAADSGLLIPVDGQAWRVHEQAWLLAKTYALHARQVERKFWQTYTGSRAIQDLYQHNQRRINYGKIAKSWVLADAEDVQPNWGARLLRFFLPLIALLFPWRYRRTMLKAIARSSRAFTAQQYALGYVLQQRSDKWTMLALASVLIITAWYFGDLYAEVTFGTDISQRLFDLFERWKYLNVVVNLGYFALLLCSPFFLFTAAARWIFDAVRRTFLWQSLWLQRAVRADEEDSRSTQKEL